MIFLDTNYLVRALIDDTDEHRRVKEWSHAGIKIYASSVAWYEFVCGPLLESGLYSVKKILSGGIINFDKKQADVAAQLFNGTGRRRSLKTDAMIAACAICSGAQLATANQEDFLLFTPFGLALA